MTSQPDKLFREKLAAYQKAAPAHAWDRIETSIDNSYNKVLWMKIAAGIVLLSIATVLLWPASENTGTQPISEVSPTKKSSEVKPVTETIPQEQTIASLAGEKQSTPKRNPKKNSMQKEPVAVKIETGNELVADHSAEDKNSITELMIESTHVATSAEPTTVTIVYTAEEVNARFLKKSISPEATSEENKTSTIQKLMDVAYTIKNSEGSIGDLRLKKDEILALNFRDNKQKQN